MFLRDEHCQYDVKAEFIENNHAKIKVHIFAPSALLRNLEDGIQLRFNL